MKTRIASMAAMGVGAALTYYLDPERGRRRRAAARDRMAHARRKAMAARDKTARDLGHRTVGAFAEARGTLREGLLRRPVDDVILVERVRSSLGRVARHAGAIDVTAQAGHVTLRGPALAHDVDDVLAAAWGVRGVRGVTNALEVHRQAEDRPSPQTNGGLGTLPALQGEAPRPEPRAEFLQENWSPTARLLASAGGGLVAWGGLTMGGPMGWALAGMGGALVARGATNTRMKRLLGIRSGRRAVDLHKTINVQAPVAEVYAFWRHFENFPRFMAHVKDIRDLGDGRSHWTVCGPAGIELRWDAAITREEPNRVLAWKTVPGAIVQHAGIVHFVPNVHRGTQVDVHLSYNPPAGAAGHAIAYLLGTDPKAMMDEDLVRLKSLMENGKASAPGKTARREEVVAA